MSWVLAWIGENISPLAMLLAFPIVVYMALLNYTPDRTDRAPQKDKDT